LVFITSEELVILFIYSTIYLEIKLIYQILLRKKSNPEFLFNINAVDQDGNTALHYISGTERYEWDFINALVRFFLRQPQIDTNIQNKKGYTPLMLACYKCNEDISRILIKHGVNLNCVTNSNVTALMMACSNRSHDIVKLLLDSQVDVNIQSRINGNTALTLVSKYYYDYNIVSLLIDKGNADVNIANWKGETPLILAASVNNIENVILFIEKGANMNVKEKTKGLAPLHIVLNNFNYYLAKYLCQHHADINVINNNSETPLILACTLYNKYGSELMIENNTDVSIKNNEGQTAKDIIERNNFNFIIGLNNSGYWSQ